LELQTTNEAFSLQLENMSNGDKYKGNYSAQCTSGGK
jgi:hypothetical protein